MLSSEEFYIGKAESSGTRYLNNVTLEEIDLNNNAMGGRAIVVHGWRTPINEYLGNMKTVASASQRADGTDGCLGVSDT